MATPLFRYEWDPYAAMRRYWQAATRPQSTRDVGLHGRPHELGNISAYLGKPTEEDYIGYLANNFEHSISWSDLEWIRDFREGPMVIKGILDADDTHDTVRFGVDGIVALSADTVLLKRAFLYALTTHGEAGVANLLTLIEKKIGVTMALIGIKSIADISADLLVREGINPR